jgi:molybdopterin-dependent oxidoreductase alpha subunit
MDQIHPTHWEAEKHDVHGKDEIDAHPLPSDGEAREDVHLRVLSESPPAAADVDLRAPAKHAAGVPGVYRAMKHLLSQMGPVAVSKTMSRLNQKGGIDCMSCAWPEPDVHRHFAEFCENGAKAVAWEATTARVTPDFFARHSVEELAGQSDYWLGQQGRITHPMVLRAGATHYAPISWDDAFALIAGELNALTSPDEAIFYTSGRASNEAAFVYQLFVRQFGTNNMPDCSNMCHESSGAALTPTLGIGKGTVTIDDFAKAQVILIIGQNPGTNHPRMLTTLEKAKKAGAKIIAINPLPEAGLLNFMNPQTLKGALLGGTSMADLFLPVRISGDTALLKGIMKELLDRDAVDRAFVAAHTAGFEDFAAALRAQPWDRLVEDSGISRELMAQAAALLASADRVIACWAMGLTQQKTAVETIQEVVNLLLLRGAVGKPGAGACPVRGHSNVQGDRTMGVWERPRKEFLDALAEEFAFDPPRRHGWDTVESIKAMHAGKGKLFFALGGNFLSATPDTHYTAAALRNTRLTVQVSIKLNRAHLITGRTALILPCLGRTEVDRQAGGDQFVTTENSMGVVEMSRGVLPPASEHLLSEPAIICRLAQATLGEKSHVDWPALAADYDRIRDLIARVIPGCQDYNAEVRRPGGFYLPNAPRDGDFHATPTGKANFTVNPLPDLALAPGQFVMTTLRTHDQFNTTIYGLDDVYRGIRRGRHVVLMNPDDVRAAGLKAGDRVDLTSRHGGKIRTAKGFAVVPYPIPPRCTATYFPEGNVLVPIDSVAGRSNTPTSKYVIITIAPSS